MNSHAGSPVLVPHPGPLRMAIAALNSRELDAMHRGDLVDLIRISRMTVGGGPIDVERLPEPDLRRLAMLVRRCCRNQVDSHRCQIGQPLLWLEAI